MRESSDRVGECTSPNFHGMIALVDDKQSSWVAKWQRIDKMVSGLYAVQVIGRLPDEIVNELRKNGVEYFSRDGVEYGKSVMRQR